MNHLFGLIWVLILIVTLILLFILAWVGVPPVFCYVAASLAIVGGCWVAVWSERPRYRG